MAELITAETVRSALREQRRGAVRDIIDSRVPGLTLRIKTIECRWSVRARLHSRQRRWDLGAVVAGDDDLDGKICLATARARAMTVREMCRKNQNPDAIVARFGGTRAQADAEASPPPPVTSPTTWTWAQAKEAFFAELERSNRKDTRARVAISSAARHVRPPRRGEHAERRLRGIAPSRLVAARCALRPHYLR
jgi:hypothetical protein